MYIIQRSCDRAQKEISYLLFIHNSKLMCETNVHCGTTVSHGQNPFLRDFLIISSPLLGCTSWFLDCQNVPYLLIENIETIDHIEPENIEIHNTQRRAVCAVSQSSCTPKISQRKRDPPKGRIISSMFS